MGMCDLCILNHIQYIQYTHPNTKACASVILNMNIYIETDCFGSTKEGVDDLYA